MFNTLASYLLGNNINDNSANLQNQGPELDLLSSSNNNIITVPDEDEDWLLVVDKDAEYDSESSSDRANSEEDLTFVEIKVIPKRRNRAEGTHNQLQQRNVTLQYNEVRPSSSSSVMEESWFVTPPSCFTSSIPMNLETSPLENLLIEHPSMSVYRYVESSIQDLEDDLVVLNFAVDDNTLHDNTELRTNARATEAPRSARSAPRQYLSDENTKQLILARKSQKVFDTKIRKTLNRNYLERSNQVRETNGRGNNQKRSNYYGSRVNSRANNNRKC